MAEDRARNLFAKLGLPDPDNIGARYIRFRRPVAALHDSACAPSRPDLASTAPTALDVTTQIDVLMAIKEAIRDTGVAALYITHDLACASSDDIMVLRHARPTTARSIRYQQPPRRVHAGAGFRALHRA